MITDEFRRSVYGRPVNILTQDNGSVEYRMLRQYATEVYAQLAVKGIHITFDIVNDPSVNGFAVQATESEYLISVNTGIANARDYLSPIIKIPAIGPASIAARFLAPYILAHEVTHVIRGHVDQEVRPLCVGGSGGGAVDEENIMDEADADALAGLTLASQERDYKGVPMPIGDMIVFFLLATQFWSEFWKVRGLDESSYPPPYARYGIIASGMKEGLRRLGRSLDWERSEKAAAEILSLTCHSVPSAASWLREAKAKYDAWIQRYGPRMDTHTQRRIDAFILRHPGMR